VFTKQHYDLATDTWSYTQVLVMAPSMMYVINTSEEAEPERERYTVVELFPEDPEQNSEFRVPINISSLQAVSAMHREELLADAICSTVFLVEEVKVKWYQQGFMRWLLVIIIVIILVVTWQYELLPSLAALAGAATGATALALWALYTVMVFAIGFLISFAGGLIGGKFGILFVLVASMMMAGVNPFSNLANSWSTLATTPSWGSAFSFIQATAPLTNFAMIVHQDLTMAKLESEMRDFLKSAREKYDQLQDAWDSFGEMPSWLDPMDLIAIQTTTVLESPDEFFSRTLNANPGILGYDLIHNFADIALMLPDTPGTTNVIDSMLNTFAEQRGAV